MCNGTYTRQRDTAVTALGRGGELFEVVVDKLATRRLHHPTAVRGGVVGSALAESDALSHWWTVGGVRSVHVQHIPAPVRPSSPDCLIRPLPVDCPTVPRLPIHLSQPNCTIRLHLQSGRTELSDRRGKLTLEEFRRRLPGYTSQCLFRKRTDSISTYLDIELAVAVAVEYIPVTGSPGGWEELYSTRRLPRDALALRLPIPATIPTACRLCIRRSSHLAHEISLHITVSPD